jgi:hypothetical protein
MRERESYTTIAGERGIHDGFQRMRVAGRFPERESSPPCPCHGPAIALRCLFAGNPLPAGLQAHWDCWGRRSTGLQAVPAVRRGEISRSGAAGGGCSGYWAVCLDVGLQARKGAADVGLQSHLNGAAGPQGSVS